MSEKITLRIEGREWLGWKSVEIVRQVDAVCGQFSLGLADRWQHEAQASPIAAGMPCEVLAGGDGLINGYIDEVRHSFSAADHGLAVSGRDKSADLVDCSAVHSPGQFKGLTLGELAAALAAPFGVPVSAEAEAGGPIAVFKIEEGETAFEALDRALKMREVLALPDGRGGLRLARLAADRCDTALVQGRNVKSGDAVYDLKDRFSDYITKGQKQGTDEEFGVAAAAVRGEARDSSVPRYRPFLVRAEGQGGPADAEARAKWEASVRAGRAVTVTVVVAGWRQGSGALWPIGALVECDIPYLRLKQPLLIAKTTFSFSSGGSTTTLELKDPAAFQPEPPQKPQAGGGVKGGGAGGDKDLQQASTDDAWSATQEAGGAK